MRGAGYYEGGMPLAQFDLSVTDSSGVIGASLVGHAKAIPIVKHHFYMDNSGHCSRYVPGNINLLLVAYLLVVLGCSLQQE